MSEVRALDLQAVLNKLGKGAKYKVTCSGIKTQYSDKDVSKARAVLKKLLASSEINEVASISCGNQQMNDI